jgi:hypothetical protein
MATVYTTTFKFRRGKAEAWAKNNPILVEAEPGYELDTGKLKIGDGKTAWNDLEYYGGDFTVDEKSLTINSKGEAEILGFSSAQPGQILQIAEDGSLTWISPISE